MKTIPILTLLLWTGLSVSCTKEASIIPVKPSEPKLVGRWNLVQITYGFSQISTTPDKAGYTETITFNADGTYQRLVNNKDGNQEEKGRFSIGDDPYTSATDNEAVYYANDNTFQPYSFQEGRLSMYQRGEKGLLIADGSTYEYQRQ